jgi:hypothetical protein
MGYTYPMTVSGILDGPHQYSLPCASKMTGREYARSMLLGAHGKLGILNRRFQNYVINIVTSKK